jgi:hypothetical protein
LSILQTATSSDVPVVIDERASGWTQVDVDWVMAIPITNTPLASHTATQINAIVTEYIEDYTYITDFELWSRGLQLFNEVDYTTVDYAYKIRVNPSSNVAWSVSTQYKLYDIGLNEISTGTALTVATTSETAYISFVGTIASPSTFMLNEGTTAEDWQAYNSPQDNFKLTADMLSVGSIRDEAYPLNGAWWKDKYVGIALTVGIGATINTTSIPLILETTGVFYAVDSVNNEAQYGTYGDVLTLTGTSTVYYQLATIVTAKIEKDGSLIQEANTTIVQLNNFATQYDITFALDSDKQREIDTTKIIYLQGEVDDLEVEQTAQGVRVTDNEADIVTAQDDIVNIEAKTDYITISQAVDLDVVETNSNASKVITDFITITQAVNLDTVESDLSTAQTDITNIELKTDFISVSASIDLDNVHEYVELFTGVVSVPSTTTVPAANLTLTDFSSYDYLDIEIEVNGQKYIQRFEAVIDEIYNFSIFSSFGTTSFGQRMFKLKPLTTTTMALYYGSTITTTFGSPANVVYATATDIDVERIIGIKI